MIDIYGTTHGRDLGAIAERQILSETASQVPAGSTVVFRGQVTTMTSAYSQLIAGLGMAIVLIYLLILVNFQVVPFRSVCDRDGAAREEPNLP